MAQTRGGVDASRAFKKLDALERNIAEASMELARELSEDAAVIARLALNSAETDWGRKRNANGVGVSAGRIRSGLMRNKLRALKPRKNAAGNVRAEVGWYYANEYFKYQERGTGQHATDPKAYDPAWDYDSAYGAVAGKKNKGGIVGAHSLWTARSWMEKNLNSYTRKFKSKFKNG